MINIQNNTPHYTAPVDIIGQNDKVISKGQAISHNSKVQRNEQTGHSTALDGMYTTCDDFAKANLSSKDIGKRAVIAALETTKEHQPKECVQHRQNVNPEVSEDYNVLENAALSYWQKRVCEHMCCGGMDFSSILHAFSRKPGYRFVAPKDIMLRAVKENNNASMWKEYCADAFTKENTEHVPSNSKATICALRDEPKKNMEYKNGEESEQTVQTFHSDANAKITVKQEKREQVPDIFGSNTVRQTKDSITDHVGRYEPYVSGKRTAYPLVFAMDTIHDGGNNTCYVKSAAMLLSCLLDNVKETAKYSTKLFRCMQEPYKYAKYVHHELYTAMTAKSGPGGHYVLDSFIPYTSKIQRQDFCIKIHSDMDLAYASVEGKSGGTACTVWKNALKNLAGTQKQNLLFNMQHVTQEKRGALNDVFRVINALEDYRPTACTVLVEYKGQALRHVETVFFDKQSAMWWCPTVGSEPATPAGYTLEEAVEHLKKKYERNGKYQILDMQLTALLLEKNTLHC